MSQVHSVTHVPVHSPGVTITYASVESPLGRMMLGATDRGLCFVQFGETHAQLLNLLQKEYPLAALEPIGKPYHQDFARWMEALEHYLAGKHSSLALPVDVRATAFQLKVCHHWADSLSGTRLRQAEHTRQCGAARQH